MFGTVAAFEFRYAIRSPLFIGTAALFFLIAFFDMGVMKLVKDAGGTTLFNTPHAIIKSHLLASILFLFVGAAFISNIILRDDQTGFGPIIRATPISKRDYLLGRFTGAFAVGALILCAMTLGTFVGTLVASGEQAAMMGPTRAEGYAIGLFLFALPNALIISAILFALATVTRSTAGTFVGVIGLMIFYLVGQRIMEGNTAIDSLRTLADPFAMSAYMAASRYLTAPQINAGMIPVTQMMVVGRLLWIGLALALLAVTYASFSFTERRPSRRQRRRARREAAQAVDVLPSAAAIDSLPAPSFDARAARAQFLARAGMEARFVFKSVLFWILLAIAFVFTLPGLLLASTIADVPLYPMTSVFVPILDNSFNTVLLVIAAYYGGELVWRERERRIDQIVDATPLPAWALMLPKLLGLMAVMIATLAVSALVAILVQWVRGGVAIEPGKFLLWYLLPIGFDACLTAVLAVFVQALSPNKFVGWGIMAAYIVALIFLPATGVSYPLYLYGSSPDVPTSDMTGLGAYWPAAWWFRLFWGAVAALLLVAVQLLWPRGTAQRFRERLSQAPRRLTGPARVAALAAASIALLSGTWIVYNTRFLNSFATASGTEQYLADYEREYLKYAALPQPVVEHVNVAVDLDPDALRADVRGRFRLVNDTDVPIDQVHVRIADPKLELVTLDFPGARLERDDPRFAYRIYRLATPMRPGERRELAFVARRAQRGFLAAGADDRIMPNGTELDGFDLMPRIGMHDSGLLDDPAARRRQGLPEAPTLPRLDDKRAIATKPSDNAWITADITVSTPADQVAIAPGKQVAERIENGRRIARFVSDSPIHNSISVQSGRFAVARRKHDGVDYAVYYDPAHHWNVERMLSAMQASIDYFSKEFGPYQFDQARIIETPYRQGGHAYPNTIAIGEQGPFGMDLRNPGTIDMVTTFVAHELSHQWWGHQVRGTRMQGTAMLIETLAQYSALMVMKRQGKLDHVRRYLDFQLDRYLKGRRAQVGGEPTLVQVGLNDEHVTYGKGALAMYLLQERLGEAAVNRALKRFVAAHRFSTPPYPRSVDLVSAFREEARTAEDQKLITDLFERITLYDLKAGEPTAIRRPDGRWLVTLPVEARKYYADPKGHERETPFAERIEVGVVGGDGKPGAIRVQRMPIRSGRNSLTFVTAAKPERIEIDPYRYYIDRNEADNEAFVP